MGFIDTMRAEGHAVESICRVLRASRRCTDRVRCVRRRRRARHRLDDQGRCRRRPGAQAEPRGLYGRRKMTAYLRRTALPEVSAGSVDRAMRTLGGTVALTDRVKRDTDPMISSSTSVFAGFRWHCCIEQTRRAGTANLPAGCLATSLEGAIRASKSIQRDALGEAQRRWAARFAARRSRDRSMQQCPPK